MSKYTTISQELALEWYEESYNIHGHVKIANLTFLPSRIVQKLDPRAFNIGWAQFIDYLYQDGYVIKGLTDHYIEEEA